MANIKSTEHLCVECRACEQICSKTAISMVKNSEGFCYPIVDQDKCIDCNLCSKVCPVINGEPLKHKNATVYAAQIKDNKTLLRSSSGGIFSIVAEYILAKGGLVFGAAWDDKLQLHHIGIDKEDDLEKLRGSKYVHSDIGKTYKVAKAFLDEGKWIYFTGTPCQIAGLKLFLRKDYSTLITSDLVCHGTPSQDIFNKFVRQMEEEKEVNLVDYSFRDKRIMGWNCASSSSYSIDKNSKKKLYHIYDKNMSAYYNAFMKGHITREDCYSCPFACPQRVGDITLADYWDVDIHHPEIKHLQDGVSLILVNTPMGEMVISDLLTKINLTPSTLEKALATSNHNLKEPTPRPQERDHSYIKASQDFISFRDSYILKDKNEYYYKRVYNRRRIVSLPGIKQILRLIGKV